MTLMLEKPPMCLNSNNPANMSGLRSGTEVTQSVAATPSTCQSKRPRSCKPNKVSYNNLLPLYRCCEEENSSVAVNMFISAANKSLLEPLVDTRGTAVSAALGFFSWLSCKHLKCPQNRDDCSPSVSCDPAFSRAAGRLQRHSRSRENICLI